MGSARIAMERQRMEESAKARGYRPEETAVRAETPGEDGEGRLHRDRVPGGSE